jgi:hypothetical protein
LIDPAETQDRRPDPISFESNDDSENYYVVLKQEGMFLTGVSEQTLREELPIFNSYDREAGIAHAISSFLHTKPDPAVPVLPSKRTDAKI